MYQLSDVDVSLSKGQLYGKKQFTVGWSAIVISVLLILLGIVSLVLSCLDWDVQMFVAAIGSIIVGVALLTLLTYCFVKDKKVKKKVSLWLEDAVKCNAISQKVDSYNAGLWLTAYKIRVKFNIGDVACERESTVKYFGGRVGFSGVFGKYVNRQISILYSPTYNEVLILKD